MFAVFDPIKVTMKGYNATSPLTITCPNVCRRNEVKEEEEEELYYYILIFLIISEIKQEEEEV
jgi:hypothetical protein